MDKNKTNVVSKMCIFDPKLVFIKVRIFINGRTSTVWAYGMLDSFSDGYVLASNLVIFCL